MYHYTDISSVQSLSEVSSTLYSGPGLPAAPCRSRSWGVTVRGSESPFVDGHSTPTPQRPPHITTMDPFKKEEEPPNLVYSEDVQGNAGPSLPKREESRGNDKMYEGKRVDAALRTEHR